MSQPANTPTPAPMPPTPAPLASLPAAARPVLHGTLRLLLSPEQVAERQAQGRRDQVGLHEAQRFLKQCRRPDLAEALQSVSTWRTVETMRANDLTTGYNSLLAAYDAQAAELQQARDRVAGMVQELGEQEVEKLRLIRELAAAIAAPTEQP